ncbi:GGDEF domain-containing protein [Sulfurimonas gotlandica]|uniref:GGDEF domain-containing protein n=1 Tax=Sulfurimonas gotlandica TaxID=1176482 RepID=UPI0001839D95|nr:GGDEF domain-containing protein [Sulfurimonas gotlandica]EDZ62808.1 diguanylate cyclase [Sulfurimonas gotlandica GD1]
MNPIKTISVNLLIPFLVSALFAVIIYNASKIPEILFDIVPYLFYGLSLLIIWVSWHFNRNRFIFVILPLILIYLGFEYFSAKKATLLFLYVSMFYPIHLLIFLVLKERGLFSFWGILKIGFFILEIAIVLYLIYYPNETLQNYLKIKLFAANFYPLKDVSIAIGIFVLFVMSALVMFGRYLLYSTTFLNLLVAFYLALFFLKTTHATEVAFLSFSIIIFILLIRESYRLAFYDELTALPGRRALVEDMAKLGRKYSLAMCDIDFFKKFNDTYGHDTGDEVLKMVASKFSEVSGGGKAYRYGGEEFVILFPSKESEESFVHVDALRQNIASTPFSVRNKQSTKKIFINVSAGITQYTTKDKDPFAVMKRADNALYKAKKAGRNQVIKD